MCGRFVRTPSVDTLVRAYGAVASSHAVEPSYNVCPSQRIAALRSGSGSTTLFDPVWGFEAPWRNEGQTLVINARIEGVAERPMFRNLLSGHRCVIPMSGYYEWVSVAETITQLGSSRRKVPFYISPPVSGTGDDALMNAAGLWQASVAGDRVVMLTTEATESVRHVHDRMPVLLDESSIGEWLHAPSVPPLGMLAVPTVELATRRVGYAVSSARSEGPQLIEPYAGDDQGTLF
jgi:putative SOS response-associated peptidase YedK